LRVEQTCLPQDENRTGAMGYRQAYIDTLIIDFSMYYKFSSEIELKEKIETPVKRSIFE